MITLVLTVSTRQTSILRCEVLVFSCGTIFASHRTRLSGHEKFAGFAHGAVTCRLPPLGLMLARDAQLAVVLACLILKLAFRTFLAFGRDVQATVVEFARDTGISIAACLPPLTLVLASLTI